MPKILLAVMLVLGVSIFSYLYYKSSSTISGAPPYGESESAAWQNNSPSNFENWVRPPGPPKVGLQVGHWQNANVPEELHRLRGNTGSTGGGKAEWEVNYSIASAIKNILEAHDVQVDLLPATVPPRYIADVFLAIHADGSEDSSATGYKFASPWRDLTGRSQKLVDLLYMHYGQATDLPQDPNISRNMRGYYAFAWWRYHHAVHPMTTAAIAETGFLTNASDRRLLINEPELPARAISQAILDYLTSRSLL